MTLTEIKLEAARLSSGLVPTEDAVRKLAALVVMLILKIEQEGGR